MYITITCLAFIHSILSISIILFKSTPVFDEYSLINYNISQLGVPNINIILLCDISFTDGFLVVFIDIF